MMVGDRFLEYIGNINFDDDDDHDDDDNDDDDGDDDDDDDGLNILRSSLPNSYFDKKSSENV